MGAWPVTITVERYDSLHSRFAQCANLTCPNGSTEDEFAIATIGDLVFEGNRALRLALCIPCAAALAAEAGR